MPEDQPLCGPYEIADILEVHRQTPRKWSSNGILPPPRQRLSTGPVWNVADIIEWAKTNQKGKYKNG
ncbi:MAG: helix-turn-helix domain-containing protein [bacterium]|nr:helix-turn-helix domain-containing protein [bacterium]